MKRVVFSLLLIMSFSIVKAQLLSETVIGTTKYDVQSNLSSFNHIVYNTDGTISAVWNYSPDTISNFPNRGTAYNYFDGTNWGAYPNSRIEPNRTGFPSIVTTSSGHELVLHHTGTSMSMSYRPTKGTGSWTYSTPWGSANSDTWAKTAASGDSVYAIWNGGGTSGVAVHGQYGPIFFSASFDGGQTWSAKRVIHEIDSTYYYGWNAEDYSIDANAGSIAILFGNYSTDLGIIKSQNGGLTWTKTIVDTHPVPFFGINTNLTDTNADGIADWIMTCSGDEHLLIDNDGMCHVWFTQIVWYSDSTTSGTTGSPFDTDGIQY